MARRKQNRQQNRQRKKMDGVKYRVRKKIGIAFLIAGGIFLVLAGRIFKINYENGASFTHKPWGHYPDECPTCGNGKEENWEIFSQYGEIKL